MNTEQAPSDTERQNALLDAVTRQVLQVATDFARETAPVLSPVAVVTIFLRATVALAIGVLGNAATAVLLHRLADERATHAADPN